MWLSSRWQLWINTPCAHWKLGTDLAGGVTWDAIPFCNPIPHLHLGCHWWPWSQNDAMIHSLANTDFFKKINRAHGQGSLGVRGEHESYKDGFHVKNVFLVGGRKITKYLQRIWLEMQIVETCFSSVWYQSGKLPALWIMNFPGGGMVKNPPVDGGEAGTWVHFLGQEDALVQEIFMGRGA